MDRNQSDLMFSVLKRMDSAGVLAKMMLIGSWCLPLYRDYYFKNDKLTVLRTRDLDFLVPREAVFTDKTDLPLLLEDLGFVLDQSYPQGYMRLNHPELIVEFLVPEVGRGSSKPYPLPALSMNAQALRFLEILSDDPIAINVQGLQLTIPHPVNFGLHKLVISSRRKNPEKADRDSTAGISVLSLAAEKGESSRLPLLYRCLSGKEQRKICTILKKAGADTILPYCVG